MCDSFIVLWKKLGIPEILVVIQIRRPFEWANLIYEVLVNPVAPTYWVGRFVKWCPTAPAAAAAAAVACEVQSHYHALPLNIMVTG